MDDRGDHEWDIYAHQKWDIYSRRRHHDESGAHTLNGSDHATRILIELSDLATYIGHL